MTTPEPLSDEEIAFIRSNTTGPLWLRLLDEHARLKANNVALLERIMMEDHWKSRCMAAEAKATVTPEQIREALRKGAEDMRLVQALSPDASTTEAKR
jgi:hypothetical protein